MVKSGSEMYRKRPVRAVAKITVIAILLVLLYAVIAWKLQDPALNRLKFNLSLPSLIGLVFVINAVSLSCIAALYGAYRWVRCDLKAPRSEDQKTIDE